MFIRSMIGGAALIACALQAGAALIVSPDGSTVYDSVNNISWLADANLAASNRFDLATCKGTGPQPRVNASGSTQCQGAAAWVAAMNAANYPGHSNWQLPTAAGTRNAPSVWTCAWLPSRFGSVQSSLEQRQHGAGML